MANPYLERMNQLQNKSTASNFRQLSDMVGLPLNRPGADGEITPPNGIPAGSKQPPQEDESYKSSNFWMNFDTHRQEDPHFDQFTGELTKLATGLRKQVESGYMPQAIAEDNIRQFIQDTTQRRAVADPHIQRQQAQDQMAQMLQAAASHGEQNPTPDSPMAQQAAEAAQQAQDNPPAIKNLTQGGM